MKKSDYFVHNSCFVDDNVLIGKGTKIWAPLLLWDKVRIIEEALRLGIPIERTWSCYNGEENPCGVCDSCRIRDDALKKLGRSDLCSQKNS